MKRLIAMILSMVLLLCLMGCEQGNNKVFTNAFLEDVVEIRFVTDEPVTGEQMQAVFSYLKSLHLESIEPPVQERDPNKATYGGVVYHTMKFVKSDGTVVKIGISNWAMSDPSGGYYAVENYVERIEQGEKGMVRSIWEICGRDPRECPW